MRHVVLSICVGLLIAYADPTLGFDPSDYRQNTYGTPNHYCDPARSLASSGAGTLATPWNMSQCATQPVAGDVVGILPGVSVLLPTTNDDNVPAFNPTNSGTSGSRIVYVTRYAAVALPNVETNSNRTEFRHNGTAENGTQGSGTGCPMLGALLKNYITYDGFYIDQSHAWMREDSGNLRADNATGITFTNYVIKGAAHTVYSNAVVYRPHNAINTINSNFRVYDFTNSGGLGQPSLFSDQYSDRNFLIEHFEISNTGLGIFTKGNVGGGNNYGTIRYGIIHNQAECMRFNALDATNTTTVHNNLCYNFDQAGFDLSNETDPPQRITFHHNTVANGDATAPNFNGPFVIQNAASSNNVNIRDNIFDQTTGSNGVGLNAYEFSATFLTTNFNGYYRGGATTQWAYNGNVYSTISAWRTATGQEANSLVLSSTPFVNRAGGDFHVSTGHAAKTASSTGGEIGAYAGTLTVGVDLSGSTGGSGDLTPPSAPIGLLIQ